MKNPFITMTAVTGKPSVEKIFKYMKLLRDNGIEQVMIYPRSGCELEYLSDEWFNTISVFLEYAKKLDMYIWLYDEYNWPSGDAGGLVSPKYSLRSITTKGENTGKINTYSTHNKELFGIKLFPDLLSFEAVDFFIRSTHEKYYELFGEYFGNTIKGFFTDEPSIGYCSSNSSIPYYEQLPEDYKMMCGSDFFEDLKTADPEFYKTAMQAVAKRFKTCYIDKIRKWCDEHSVEMCGHLMSDSEPFGATKNNGDLLTALSGFSMPGIDEISTVLNDTYELSLFGAAEYAGRGKNSMAELFALGPCDMTYTKKKCMLFFAACFKINKYFLAVSHMDMRGNMKICDYFNDFSASQPDFAGMRLLAEDAELALKYADKDYCPDVYVEYPTDVCASRVNKGFNDKLFANLINSLTYYQIQWKYSKRNDIVKDAPVIKMTEEMDFIFENIRTDNPEELCRKIAKPPFVTTIDGKLCENIFVRKFSNGQFVVLNRGEKSGKYLVNGKEKEIEGFGVITEREMKTIPVKKTEAHFSDFDVRYLNDNLIRCMFINSQDKAAVYSDCRRNVEFVLRNSTTAFLNGQEILADKKSDSLPCGMEELYKVSKGIAVETGENVIKSDDDYKYMPSCLLKGDFCAASIPGDVCILRLSERKRKLCIGEKICDFGGVEFTQKVYIPKEARSLEIKGTTLYTCVYINDKLMGKRIHSPYIYEIDSELCGKDAELKIVQYSSLGPVFGDVRFWDEHSNKVSWKGTENVGQTNFGIGSAAWLL